MIYLGRTWGAYAMPTKPGDRSIEVSHGLSGTTIHSLRLTWKLPEGLGKWSQVFQRHPGTFHVSLGEDFSCLLCHDAHMMELASYLAYGTAKQRAACVFLCTGLSIL